MLKPRDGKENPNQQLQQQPSLNRNHFFPAAVSSSSHVFLHFSTFFFCMLYAGKSYAKIQMEMQQPRKEKAKQMAEVKWKWENAEIKGSLQNICTI